MYAITPSQVSVDKGAFDLTANASQVRPSIPRQRTLL